MAFVDFYRESESFSESSVVFRSVESQRDLVNLAVCLCILEGLQRNLDRESTLSMDFISDRNVKGLERKEGS